jgi:hypothetical protein
MLSRLPGSTACVAALLLASAPSHHTATGTLIAYDAPSRLLTVRSATGLAEFHVAVDARVWLGTRRLPAPQLGAHAGAQVTVAWSEAGGVRTTHTVRVAEGRASPRP